MDTNLKKFFIILAAAVLIMVVWAFLSYFRKGRRKGRKAEKKVANTIAKLGRNDNIRVMNNVYLPLYNNTVEIDHLVFGRFGVLVVETKGISGSISGSGKKLVHKVGTRVHKLYNPELQNKTHIDNVVHHLRKGGFENTPVYGAVVFTDKDLIRNSDLGMNLDEFKIMFKNLKNHGCNQDVIYHHFQKIAVTNPIKKLFHNFNKKDWD